MFCWGYSDQNGLREDQFRHSGIVIHNVPTFCSTFLLMLWFHSRNHPGILIRGTMPKTTRKYRKTIKDQKRICNQ